MSIFVVGQQIKVREEYMGLLLNEVCPNLKGLDVLTVQRVVSPCQCQGDQIHCSEVVEIYDSMGVPNTYSSCWFKEI